MFTELSIISNFTFLTGASHAEEYVARAAELGLSGLAIADENSVAGVVRAHAAVRELAREVAARQEIEARDGMIGPPAPEPRAPDWAHVPRFYPAAKLVLREGVVLTVLPQTRKGWGRLSRLISTGRLRVEKGACDLRMDDLMEGMEELVLLLHPPEGAQGEWARHAKRLTQRFADQCYLLMAPRYDGQDGARFDRLAALAEGSTLTRSS